MNKNLRHLAASFILMVSMAVSCKKGEPILLSIQDDKNLGAQLEEEIDGNPEQYPVIKRSDNRRAYEYFDQMVGRIMNSGEVRYKDDFDWSFKLIKDDEVLNAFAAPGGKVYVYTGLIKYLDKEDDLAGVIGHEIAHADRRHTSRQLERVYGLQMLLSIAIGQNPAKAAEIAAALAGNLTVLRFSRNMEREADEYSVIYLAKTPYQCNGAYSFFQKLIEEKKTGRVPEFLSTHPDPEERVEDINKKAAEIGCSTRAMNPATYQDFKRML